MHVLCVVISKTSGLLVILSSPPDALPITLSGPCEMIKAYSSILGAHTHVYCQQQWLGGDGDIICMCVDNLQNLWVVGRAFFTPILYLLHYRDHIK